MRSFINWVHSLAYVVKGASAMRRGDDDAVIRYYTRAIEISPEDLDYYYARGHAHWHKRELGLAIADFTSAIGLNPDDVYAHLVRGALFQEKGFVAQALADLSFVLERADIPLAYYLRASCHAEDRDYDRALADLAQVLEMEPHHEKALMLKAKCLLEAEGDLTKSPDLPG
jgi:tetratricopeptide (TPR) repeat protein